MEALAVTRCARPVVRTTSTYTVLGFAGYGIASLVAAVLFVVWDLPLADRLVAAFAPPLAFLIVVKIARRSSASSASCSFRRLWQGWSRRR